MIANGVQDRNGKVEEYLQLLRLLAFELERAMQAIAQNSLPEFEDSVCSQEALSARLTDLAGELNVSGPTAAAKILRPRKRRYDAADPRCLRHSSETESALRRIAPAFQPLRRIDGVALQFVQGTIPGGNWPQVESIRPGLARCDRIWVD